MTTASTRVPSIGGRERARLRARLDAAWARPLTLVVAPAGSGKTTLLAGFALSAQAAGRPVAWYQAAGPDANRPALLGALHASLAQVLPGLAGRAGWDTVAGAADALDTALEARGGEAVALVVDDAHVLAGTGAEQALGELLTSAPAALHVLVSSRQAPAFDLSRWRIAGQLAELGPDDLRFRSWEIEELFVHHYHQRLPPAVAEELARRSEGWAAGLALFHVATRDKPPAARRRVLESLSTRERDTREYLERSVLADLDEDQRAFLVHTSVLGSWSAACCDTLLGRDDSAGVLAQLARRNLLLPDDQNTYHANGVLHAYLEALLVEQVGEAAARDLSRKAGAILDAAGTHAEALRAYCRAEDTEAAEELLARSGEGIFGALGDWAPSLPTQVADHEAWTLFARAKTEARSGRWPAAIATYRRTEAAANAKALARAAADERAGLETWMDPSAATGPAAGLLRGALRSDPLDVARELAAAGGDAKLARGFALFVAGHIRDAAATLSDAADEPERDSVLGRWGAFVGALLRSLVGAPFNDLPATLDALDDASPPWLGRLLRQLMAGPSPELETQVAAARVDAAGTENPWIELGLLLVQALVQTLLGELEAAVATYDETARLAEGPGAGVLASWATTGAALVEAAFDPATASARATAAVEAAERVGCPGAGCLALLVAARLAGDPEWEQAARALEDAGALHMAPAVSCYLDRIVPAGGVSTATPLVDPAHAPHAGTPHPPHPDHAPRMPIAPVLSSPSGPPAPAPAPPGPPTPPAKPAASVQDLVDAANALACPLDAFLPQATATPPAEERDPLLAAARPLPRKDPEPPLEVRTDGDAPLVEVLCLGSFSLTVDGRPIDVSATKPRLRSLLYRLALDTGRPVHRDQLRYALWPDDSERNGTRNLQVAVSALRQQLDALGGKGAGAIVTRRGDAYLLDPGAGGSDLRRFEEGAERGRRDRRRGERADAIETLRAALALYRGDLLADEGLSEWVLGERERLRLVAAETAELLAECLLEGDDPAGAVEVAERGVWIDRYRDRLWRVMIEAHERNGNLAAAARSSRQYATVLDELGIAGEMAAD